MRPIKMTSPMTDSSLERKYFTRGLPAEIIGACKAPGKSALLLGLPVQHPLATRLSVRSPGGGNARRVAKCLLLLLCVVLAGCTTPAVGPPIRVLRDLRYVEREGVALGLDLYLPEARPAPVVVLVHGGGWKAGDKRYWEAFGRTLAGRGYAACAVSYRLLPGHAFPAALEDVWSAIRWVREHGPEHGLDGERVAALGMSAGAHLALLAASVGPADTLPGGERGPAERLRGAVSIYGPTDLGQEELRRLNAALLDEFLGGHPAEVASPVTYVGPDDPPCLVLHGTADELVPVEQAYILWRRICEKGGSGRLVPIQGASHHFKSRHWEEAADPILTFLAEVLR